MTKKIMFVDDEKDVLIAFEQIINESSKEFEFIGVTSGEDCLDRLRNGEKPDLICLDIMMPGLSGWEVYDKLREHPNWKQIPIIFLTARTDQIATEVGELLGDDYIEKPVEADDLINHIKNVFKISS